MIYRVDKQVITTHMDRRTGTQTNAGNDHTRRPKLASGKKLLLNDMILIYNLPITTPRYEKLEKKNPT